MRDALLSAEADENKRKEPRSQNGRKDHCGHGERRSQCAVDDFLAHGCAQGQTDGNKPDKGEKHIDTAQGPFERAIIVPLQADRINARQQAQRDKGCSTHQDQTGIDTDLVPGQQQRTDSAN